MEKKENWTKTGKELRCNKVKEIIKNDKGGSDKSVWGGIGYPHSSNEVGTREVSHQSSVWMKGK